jgi:hypothetical protein
MEARELRIGNMIFINGVVVTVDARTLFDFEDRRTKEPIPITESRLEFFGFIEGDGAGEYYLNDGIFGIAMEHLVENIKAPPLHIWDASFTGAPCLFVHQLQNLYFALTGTELKTT